MLYSKIATNFSMTDFLIYIGVNILVFAITIFIISRSYFKINSALKRIQKNNTKKAYKIKVNRPKISIIKKELKRAINTPVLITNAVFGLVLFVIACIVVAVKFDAILTIPKESMPITLEQIEVNIPIILFMLIAFGSLTSSITSSMISLEGKSFIILRSIPVKPYTIIMSKVYTALLMMFPFLLVGDLIFYIRFKFDLIEIILTLIASVVMPFVAELIGILVNLKYPVLDAQTDAEVVKQSGSSNVSALIGLLLVMIIISVSGGAIAMGLKAVISLAILDAVFLVLLIWLLRRARTKGVERFNRIDI